MSVLRTYRAVVPLFLAAIGAAGCASPAIPSGAPARSDLGLGELLASHGGASAWKRHAAVSFGYRMRPRGMDEFLEFPAVAFRLRDYRHIWLRSHEDDRWVRVSLERPSGFIDPELERTVTALNPQWTGDPGAIDFAFRALRHLFQPVLSTTNGPWSVRRLVAPAGVRAPRTVEIVPRTATSPLAACLLLEDPASGLLAATVSATSHPWIGADTVRTTFTRYEESSGVRVSRRRVHDAGGNATESAIDPFNAIAGPAPPPPVLEEEITTVTFLDERFAQTHLLLPGEDEQGDPSGDERGAPDASGD